jgi:hypothetical protein
MTELVNPKRMVNPKRNWRATSGDDENYVYAVAL